MTGTLLARSAPSWPVVARHQRASDPWRGGGACENAGGGALSPEFLIQQVCGRTQEFAFLS